MLHGGQPEYERKKEAFRQWQSLVDEYLPTSDEESGWRFSGVFGEELPPQGFKLHISATVLNANTVFERCAPYLRARQIPFKSVIHLSRLSQLNMGMLLGFSQIGKFMTVYPRTAEQALRVACDLDALTDDLESPAVPFDLPYRPGSAVHYRYGAFREIEVEDDTGNKVTGIRDPEGNLVPDRREFGSAVPDWVENPFPNTDPPSSQNSLIGRKLLVFDALSQRGKGGVYKAVDIRRLPARYCVLKEGRRLGEVDWSGRDGNALVQREETVLRALAETEIGAPRIHAAFEVEGNAYLALEFIEGECLAERLANPRRKLPMGEALATCFQAARTVARIHQAGWAWRDCKPLNLILAEDGTLRPIDFEGAVRIEEPSGIPYGTPAYSPPEIHRAFFASYEEEVEPYEPTTNVPEDLYALGATLFQILTSYVPTIEKKPLREGFDHLKYPPVGVKRKGVPEDVRRLVAELMVTEPSRRPSAAAAAQRLSVFARGLSRRDRTAGRDC